MKYWVGTADAKERLYGTGYAAGDSIVRESTRSLPVDTSSKEEYR